MARQYQTKYGSVVVSRFELNSNFVHMTAVLMKDDARVDITRCEVTTPKGTEEEYRIVRRSMVKAVIDKYEEAIKRGYVKHHFTNDEVAVGVIEIVNRRLREYVNRA